MENQTITGKQSLIKNNGRGREKVTTKIYKDLRRKERKKEKAITKKTEKTVERRNETKKHQRKWTKFE